MNHVVNGSFETPVTSNYSVNPTNVPNWSWQFGGICANGSTLNNPNAPDGVQAGFTASGSSISGAVTNLVSGTTYELVYYVSATYGNMCSAIVSINGVNIDSYNAGYGFVRRSVLFTANFTGNNGIQLSSTNQYAVFDNVQVNDLVTVNTYNIPRNTRIRR